MGLVGLIVLIDLLALIPARIAQKKGRSFWEWFLFGLVLWIVAMIASLVIVDREQQAGQRANLAFAARLRRLLRTNRGPWIALAAILALASALRAIGIGYGLPYLAILNSDEQYLVPRAWRIAHGYGLDPHWYGYPTLLMYVFSPFQYMQDSVETLPLRLVVAALGVAAVAATWALGRRAYGTTAAVVAAAIVAVETTHVSFSHMAVTDVPLSAGVAASLALMVSARLEWAGVAVGLATSLKYPGLFLLAPLVVAAWGQWRRLAVSIALAAVAFCETSPYVVVHVRHAWADASFTAALDRKGWLGSEHDPATPVAWLVRLREGVGLPILIIVGIGLLVALLSRRRADLILLTFVAVYYANLLFIRAHFDRYTLPLVPALAAVAGRVRVLALVTLVLLAVFPLRWSIQDDIALTRTDTRVVAERWLLTHVPKTTMIATDAVAAPAEADGYPVLRFRLPLPGQPNDENRDLGRLRSKGIRVLLIDGGVAQRVTAAARRYPLAARFYRQLPTHARRLFYIQEGNGLSGPWIAVYRL